MKNLLLFGFLVVVAYAQDPISQIQAIFATEMQTAYQNGEPWLRNAHAKQHGCVRAYVKIDTNLPSNLQIGIFNTAANNYSAEGYPAFIRFSNGQGRGFTDFANANESDSSLDIRGMAIKILGIEGPKLNQINAETQDFHFTTDNVAFLPDMDTALSFFQAVFNGKLSLAGWLAVHPRLALLYAGQGIIIDDLLTVDWYAPVCSSLGETAVKWKLTPCSGRNFSPAVGADFNYLREQLQADLTNGQGCFDWWIQMYSDPENTPIDDVTIAWDTPFQHVGQVIIPSQYVWSEGQDAYCRYLGFNPKNSIVEHQPQGAIQDIRSAVYTAQQTLRHQLNSQINTEPTIVDWENYSNL